MGISTIDEVLPHVKSEKFQDVLRSSKTTHEKLCDDISMFLKEYDAPKKSHQLWLKVWYG